MTFSSDRLSVYNLGDIFSNDNNAKAELERGVRYRDAVQLTLPSGEVWVFDYGVVVFWGVEEDERQSLVNRLKLDQTIISDSNQENFRFAIAKELRINRDVITIMDENPLTRLAVSHALAQSLKLMEYEQQAQITIQNYSDLPEELANTGKIHLSSKAIAKIRGRLFSTKSDIILHYGLLDTPDFIWEYPEYETIYNSAARYLEIHQRVELLSKKLETIHEMFEMLAEEQKHQHSAFLEWIIIVLIGVEIVLFVAQELQTWILGSGETTTAVVQMHKDKGE